MANLVKKTPFHIVMNVLVMLALGITLVSILVPLNPVLPVASLDASWVFSINQAVAQHLVFGKDFIFTFGPYGSIYTHAYHPATDGMMLSGSLYLALSYFVVCCFLMKGVKWPWRLLLCGPLALVGSIPKDAVFFLYPLLAGLAVFKIVPSQENNYEKKRRNFLSLLCLFSLFGLLVLIKGSLLMPCIVVLLCCSIFLIVNKRACLVWPLFIAPLLSICFFWVISGQSLATLPGYFISIKEIIAGYTEAMALYGKQREILLYLLLSSWMLGFLVLQKKYSWSARGLLVLLVATFLFISFKAGFVRHDGHAFIAAAALMIMAALLPFIVGTKRVKGLILCCFIGGIVIYAHYTEVTPERLYHSLTSPYLSQWQGLKRRIHDPRWPQIDFEAALATLKKQAAFPSLPGAADIYSYDQSLLIASDNQWSPRPIFQSYSVYTPLLAEKNKNHLLEEQAPENIFFAVEPIDGRVPSLEDGASWPVLLNHYELTQVVGNFLLLKKKENSNPALPLESIFSEEEKLGKTVSLPTDAGFLFAKVTIKPTLLGRLAAFFLKPTLLKITFHLQDGTTQEYRFISCMAQSGFLLSPLIENTASFQALYQDRSVLEGKKVVSFCIDASKYDFCWKKKYTLLLESMPLPPQKVASEERNVTLSNEATLQEAK